MKKTSLPKKLRYPLAIIALLAVLAWLALRESPQLAQVENARRGPLTRQFSEEGKTRLRQRYVITAPIAGLLRRIELEPGDAVHAGQVLALIEPATSGLLDARSRAQAEAEIRAGQSLQAAARQRASAARAAEVLARSNLQRARVLLAERTLSQASFDEVEARARAAQAELAAAQADADNAAQRVTLARATLAQEGRSNTAGKPLSIPAPVSGVVLKRLLQSATPVSAGQALLEIGDATQLEIEAELLSTDAVQLVPGMTAKITRWGGEGTLDARISRVEPGGFTKISALGVEEQRTRVILDITSPRSQWAALGDAYRVELDFILEHQDDALQVPAAALFRQQSRTRGDADDGWALYRVVNGRARLTPVRIGLRAATAVQILEGVQAGDAVILQPDERLRDGSRVEAK